jgi:tetratricopeptide (TPR) repeat protein
MRFQFVGMLVIALMMPTGASADDWDDCRRASTPHEKAVEACTRLIDARKLPPAELALAYHARSHLFRQRGRYTSALGDLDECLRTAGEHFACLTSRALLNQGQYGGFKNYDEALKDADRAIRARPELAPGYNIRGLVYKSRRDDARAIADFTRAIEIAGEKGFTAAYTHRADLYERRGEKAKAIADYKAAIQSTSTFGFDHIEKPRAVDRLAALEGKPVSTVPVAPAAALPPVGRRVALVIGNSAYRHSPRLRNPENDARRIGTALRQVGFTDVHLMSDLGLTQMTQALKAFGDKVADADWAVIYFAGHGIEMAGVNYLIPVDAVLERDAHVPDEAVSLDRVLEKLAPAKRLKLVILDACRNNPFAARMIRSAGATRSIGRGLGRLEPEGDVLVAYAARHGTVAEDGDKDNSPFAAALAEGLTTPNLDVRLMFGRIRDRVRDLTSGRQEPFLYGSLGGGEHYFVVGR